MEGKKKQKITKKKKKGKEKKKKKKKKRSLTKGVEILSKGTGPGSGVRK